MTENDLEMIRRAENVRGFDYGTLINYLNQCDSREAKDRIEGIIKKLYRKEEAACDMI